RGAHQRLDDNCTERDDVNYLKHSLAFYNGDKAPRIEYSDVKITKSQPKARLYGAAAEEAAAKEAAEAKQAEEKA
ncbi:fumarate reductase (quinol) flavoprotein subunit, partial [Photobacterium frigidiphilum]